MENKIRDKLYKAYTDAKDNLLEELYSAKTVEDMEEALIFIGQERLLPMSLYCNSCPEFIENYMDSSESSFYRYEECLYMDTLDLILDSKEVRERLNEEAIKRYKRFLIRRIFEYVKENEFIGFKFDW